MDGIAQSTSTPDELQRMALLEQIVKDLRKEAVNAKASKTTTVNVNGRLCNITAARSKKKMEITAEYVYTPLGSRVCQQVAKFRYNRRNVGNRLKTMVEQIYETDRINAQIKADKIAKFSAVLNEYITQGIKINKLPTLTPKIKEILDAMQTLVQENDLSSDEISTLRAIVVNFGSNERLLQFPNKTLSINENDCDYNCLEIAIQLEAIEILLDAKERGYVGLERNGVPQILGQGQYNVVQLAYTQENKKGPIALKPCDLAKEKHDGEAFTRTAQLTELFIGPPSGIYRRNRITSDLQDMFCDIGKKFKINVPHVIASVFGAEVKKIPCIAMEWLDGLTLCQAARKKQILYDSEFIRRESWMQILDILAGQIDRHPNNVMLTKNGPVAFDHDLSFPTHPPRSFASIIPKVIAMTMGMPEDGRPAVAVDGVMTHNYCMLPVIDSEMYTIITNLDLQKLKGMYQKRGLPRSAMKAAMARAQALKKKAEKLKQRGLVIEPNEWEHSEKVKTLCSSDNFYAKWHFSSYHEKTKTE